MCVLTISFAGYILAAEIFCANYENLFIYLQCPQLAHLILS